MTDALNPCPWCGAGKTDIHPNGRMWTGQRYSEPTSVSIRHWCEDVPGQPHRMIERVGRDEASAVEAWNRRAAIAAQPGPQWHEAVARLVTGFEHVSGIARQWEPDYSSGADRAKWARATEACADVAKLLAAAPDAPQSHPQR